MNAITSIGTINTAVTSYQEITTHVDKKHGVAWCYMQAATGPCFTTALLEELNDWSQAFV